MGYGCRRRTVEERKFATQTLPKASQHVPRPAVGRLHVQVVPGSAHGSGLLEDPSLKAAVWSFIAARTR